MTNEPSRPKGIFLLNALSFDLIYGPDEQRDLARLLDLHAQPFTPETLNASVLREAEVIMTGWGVSQMDAVFLAAAPRLRAVFHGAGSIRSITTDAFWDREIVITSAYAANAVPVAEYTLATILLSLKNFWSLSAATKRGEGHDEPGRQVPGGYHSTVGFISCGMVARRTLHLMDAFDLRRLVACPFLSVADAQALSAELCPLDEIFSRADVVSLHTPNLPETRGMITGRHFAAMKKGATFINSARGAVVRENEMIEVLRARPDLTVVLDVTDPEPPVADSPLLTLPNVVLTPHIAGSMGPECRRMGRYMVDEVQRYLAGEPLQWQITKERAATLA